MSATAAGRLEEVQYLIDHKADVNAQTTAHYTPLKLAYRIGRKQIAEILVKNGAKSE